MDETNRMSLPPIIVPTHGLTRYLRVRLGVTDGVMWWEVPRTILGVVPAGVRRIDVPVDDVGSLQVHRTVRPFGVLVGVALLVTPLVLGWWWLALPMGVFGLWVILVALGPRLEVETGAGRRETAAVCFGHQFDAELFIDAVTDMAAEERRAKPAG
jgi:hypothetical protein